MNSAALMHLQDGGLIHSRAEGSAGEAFDLAFLDPPYGKGLGETALARLAEGNWLKPGALCVLERGSEEADFAVEGFEPLDARDYGAARVHFLRYAP